MATKKQDDVQDVTAKPEKANAEALAGLEGLEKQAAGNEQQGQAEAQQQQAKQEKMQTDTIEHDLCNSIGMAAGAIGPFVWWLTPEQFEQLWGDRVQKEVAKHGAEIMRRHGLSMGDVMNKYGPYIALGGTLAPSLMVTVKLLKVKRLQIEQQGGGSGTAPDQAG